VLVLMAMIVTMTVAMTMAMTVTMMMMAVTVTVSMSLMQYLSHRDVDQNATARHDEHDLPVDVLRVKQAVNGLINEPYGQSPNQKHTEQRAHNLRPHIAVRQFGGRLLLRHPQCNDRDHESAAIGE